MADGLFTDQQRRPVSVLLPCAGFDAPGQALEALGVRFELAGAWEVAGAPARVLEHRYGRGNPKLHLRSRGNVLETDAGDVLDAEVGLPSIRDGRLTDRRANRAGGGLAEGQTDRQDGRHTGRQAGRRTNQHAFRQTY